MIRFDLETETLKEKKFPSDILNERRCVLGRVEGSVSVTVKVRRHYMYVLFLLIYYQEWSSFDK